MNPEYIYVSFLTVAIISLVWVLSFFWKKILRPQMEIPPYEKVNFPNSNALNKATDSNYWGSVVYQSGYPYHSENQPKVLWDYQSLL